MSESDSLDHITLDSDDILTIERFENNYYNHKKNIIQNGGNNNKKLENNIIRLYNCYVLSENQDKLSLQIKKRLDNKIVELANNLIGGRPWFWVNNDHSESKLELESKPELESKSELDIKSELESKSELDIKSELESKSELDIKSELESNLVKQSDFVGQIIKNKLKKIIIDSIQPIIIQAVDDYKDTLKQIITDKIQPLIIQSIDDKQINISEIIINYAKNYIFNLKKRIFGSKE